jgi:putative membrane protein
MMGWYGTGMMGLGGWLFMGLFWVALLVLVVWLVVRLLPSRQPPAGGQETPEDILDRRFARGEIDEQTYASQRAALANTRGPRR